MNRRLFLALDHLNVQSKLLATKGVAGGMCLHFLWQRGPTSWTIFYEGVLWLVPVASLATDDALTGWLKDVMVHEGCSKCAPCVTKHQQGTAQREKIICIRAGKKH